MTHAKFQQLLTSVEASLKTKTALGTMRAAAVLAFAIEDMPTRITGADTARVKKLEKACGGLGYFYRAPRVVEQKYMPR